MRQFGQTNSVAAAKTSYLKTLTITGLAGALIGNFISQAVVEKPTVGSTTLATIIGAAAVLIPYGFWLRTGGPDLWRNPAVSPEVQTSFAGVRFGSLPGMQVPQVQPRITVRQQWVG